MDGSNVHSVLRAMPNQPRCSDTSKRCTWPNLTGVMYAGIAVRSTRELVTSEITWKKYINTLRPWWTPRVSPGFKRKSGHTKVLILVAGNENHATSPTAIGYLTLTPALQLVEDESLLKKTWTCNKCPKSFSQQASLSRHDREVHQAQLSHQCPACSSRFPRREHLQRHLQRVHRDLPIPLQF